MDIIDNKRIFNVKKLDANEAEENLRFLWCADQRQFQSRFLKGMNLDVSSDYEFEELVALVKAGDIDVDIAGLKNVFRVNMGTLNKNNIRII